MQRWLCSLMLIISFFFGFVNVVSANEATSKMYYLGSDTCPVCNEASQFLDRLKSQGELNYEIIYVEISKEREKARALFEQFEIPPQEQLVPLFIFEDKHILGFNQIVEGELTQRLSPHFSSGSGFLSNNLENIPLLFATVLIGTVDGFNPCSLWALMFLISMVIRFNSRKKMAIVGGVFIVTVAIIYGLFMAGTFSIVVRVIDFFWFRFALFSLAMIVAIVNIREGFGKKSSLSFTIKDEHKKSYVKKIRERLFRVESVTGIVLASISIAALASFIELPCTAGFPVIWNGLVSSYGVGLGEYGFYLAIYLLMYILMELIIVVFMVWTMRKAFMGQFIGENLKLLSGMLMGFLAIILLIGYEYMNNIWIVLGGSIAIVVLSVIIMFIRKLIKP
ncbi:hypothetical protein H1D32_17720 [Anaerobacillus sp. CMMVII]|uniref:hypothetical protein n=1 Tax=Anaerobacillus sp. CMMVII TaxID=2755588 RepID=UPI0021B7F534|nr:hypothetical protein [Anaerobacillus sp. CMMVII]MCT8139381.1 hypothetical protein [Anaerobacillus sp. CMMVII]